MIAGWAEDRRVGLGREGGGALTTSIREAPSSFRKRVDLEGHLFPHLGPVTESTHISWYLNCSNRGPPGITVLA